MTQDADESPPRIEEVHEGEQLAPPRDPDLVVLVRSVLDGVVTRYWAMVPRVLVRPFVTDYNPSVSATWAPVYRHVVEQMRRGVYQNLLTYQVDDMFVVGEDYLAYYAYQEVAPEWVPCYILGEPKSDAIRGVRLGPEELAQREALERHRDWEQLRWLYEFHQRSDIRELNGFPPLEPPPARD